MDAPQPPFFQTRISSPQRPPSTQSRPSRARRSNVSLRAKRGHLSAATKSIIAARDERTRKEERPRSRYLPMAGTRINAVLRAYLEAHRTDR